MTSTNNSDGSEPLSNAKHERFAQEIAKGTEAAQAYVLIGFKRSEANARRLKATSSVRDRIAYLQACRAERQAQVDVVATTIAAEKLAITKERVLGELAKIGFSNMLDYVRVGDDGLPYTDFSALDRDKAAVIQEVHVEMGTAVDIDENGERTSVPVRKVRFKLADKRAALVDLGRHLGLFIQRIEHGQPGDFERLSDEQLLDEVTKEAAELGIVLPENTTPH